MKDYLTTVFLLSRAYTPNLPDFGPMMAVVPLRTDDVARLQSRIQEASLMTGRRDGPSSVRWWDASTIWFEHLPEEDFAECMEALEVDEPYVLLDGQTFQTRYPSLYAAMVKDEPGESLQTENDCLEVENESFRWTGQFRQTSHECHTCDISFDWLRSRFEVLSGDFLKEPASLESGKYLLTLSEGGGPELVGPFTSEKARLQAAALRRESLMPCRILTLDVDLAGNPRVEEAFEQELRDLSSEPGPRLGM